MKHLESLKRTQVKLQGCRPSPEASRRSQTNLQVLVRVNDVESGEICSKKNKFDHFVDPALLFFYPDLGSWLQLISSNHLTMGNNIRILMYNYQKKCILLC